MYSKKLGNGIIIRSTQAEDAEQLEQLQVKVFPTLADEERFKAAHYHRHLEVFAEGQFVAADRHRIVGMTTTIRYHFDFDHLDHTFEEMIDGGWIGTHDPSGRWLYGLDLGVDPDYRRMGIARELYFARQWLVENRDLKGQITVGMPSGYGKLKDRITAQEYFEKLVNGQLVDPTLSPQMKIGFKPKKLIANYLNDPVCDNYGLPIALPRHPGNINTDFKIK